MAPIRVAVMSIIIALSEVLIKSLGFMFMLDLWVIFWSDGSTYGNSHEKPTPWREIWGSRIIYR